MTLHDQFVHLVTTGCLAHIGAAELDDARTARVFVVGVVARAMSLPDWSPRVEDVRAAGGLASLVNEFLDWNFQSFPNTTAPAWVAQALPAGH